MLQNVQIDNFDEGFTFNVTLDEVYTTSGDGYWSEVVKNVRVTDMGMFVSTVEEDGEFYGDGDFYVLYDEDTWDNNKDGLIYTDSAFLESVQNKMRSVLEQMGVDTATAKTAADSIGYSEQGMQDDGRVSFDAYGLADFLRKHFNSTITVA